MPSAAVVTPRQCATDEVVDPRNVSADAGNPRRLLEQDLRYSFCFAPHDDASVHPEQYQQLRFLSYNEIAEAFVAWMLSSPRTAFLIGWPITVDEVWTLAKEVFEIETLIMIESRNNFLATLAKRPEVARIRNKRVRSDRVGHGWEKTTVYRFSAVEQLASRTQDQRLRQIA